ncbi:MAG TPA: hypothetical protein VE890_17570, partial [Thermoguttaceae bacterium]|nr:hypothetical protein [Thermoguttaceae bacterium]
MRLPADSPLPLPADRPHVGPYRTLFAELFATRAAPPRARLMEQTLPIRWRAIEDRAGAVGMSEDALAVALADYQAGRARVPDVLRCLAQCTAHRQALMASVCRYNADIADYALAVAGPTVGGRALVSMLIQPSPHSVEPLLPRRDSDVQPTGLQRSMRDPRGPQRAVPTPASRPDDAAAEPSTTPGRTPNELPWVPSRASLLDKADPATPSADASGSAVVFREMEPGKPSELPRQSEATGVPTTAELPMIPVDGPVDVPAEPVSPTTLNKPVVEVVP